MKSKSGFTLIELMIVICLMAVLSGIAVTGYLNLRPALRLSGAARQILGDLLAARMKAISENNNYKVIFLDAQQYQILDDDDGDGNADTGEWSVTKNIQQNYPEVAFNLASAVNTTFSPKGTATSQSVTLQNSAGSKALSVSIAGRVTVN